MELVQAIKHILDGDAFLFTGAGFSIGAIAINGKPLLGSHDLAKSICKLVDIPEDEETDMLSDAAQDYLDSGKSIEELILFLKSNFEIATTKDFHKTIANLPWRIIFTTNYDNIFELASTSKTLTHATLDNAPSKFTPHDRLILH